MAKEKNRCVFGINYLKCPINSSPGYLWHPVQCASHVYGKQKRKPTHTTKHATMFGGAIFEASILVPPANIEHSGESRTTLLHRTCVKIMGAGKISPLERQD